jgi:type IV secretory pathway TrbD component
MGRGNVQFRKTDARTATARSLRLVLGLFAMSFGLAVLVWLGLAVSVAMRAVVTMALEELARLAPLVLFAGWRKHRGKGEEGGNNLGLHVGRAG